MKVVKKALLWLVIGLSGYWILTVLIFGDQSLDTKAGIYSYYWSGLDALVTDEEFGFERNTPVKTTLKGVDGPYISKNFQFLVDSDNRLSKKSFKKDQAIHVLVANTDRDSFSFTLKENLSPTYHYSLEADHYPMPRRLIAISDIEGNFDGFYSFLLQNDVIDKNFNWTFGDGHLVLNGDFVDRGNNVTQVLWLIYMLEGKAEKQGGKVHFVLGNHEIMNMYGDNSYSDFRYIEVAKQISHEQHWDKAGKFLYSSSSELGQWLRSKNVIEKIGDYIFVHAGIKKKIIDEKLAIPEINRITRKYYGISPDKDKIDKREALILSSYDSPYWDRSLSMSLLYSTFFFFNDPFHAAYHKTTQQELEQVLAFYKASKMVIGHSVVDNITADYNGKVIKIDIKHGQGKYTGHTKGLLIENGIEYEVDDLGKKIKLKVM